MCAGDLGVISVSYRLSNLCTLQTSVRKGTSASRKLAATINYIREHHHMTVVKAIMSCIEICILYTSSNTFRLTSVVENL